MAEIMIGRYMLLILIVCKWLVNPIIIHFLHEAGAGDLDDDGDFKAGEM